MEVIPHAGRLYYFFDKWRNLTEDPVVLGFVNGYVIPINGPVTQNVIPENSKFSNLEINQLNIELESLQKIGAIIKCNNNVPGQYLSKIFLIPKPNGSYRFILNLKNLNKFIHPQHFKMEDIRTVTKLMTKDCYMATVDLQDAYFLVPISNESKRLLRFKFQNIVYEFQCLPFGLSLAPLIFTKLMKPVISLLRSKGFILAIYLDDIICIGNSYTECSRCVTETVSLLKSLGFVINLKKSSLSPSQVQTYLGFELDSENMCLRLPDSKRKRILEQIEKVSVQKSTSIRNFAKLLGTLCAACPGVAYGWVYTKRFEREKFLALRNSNENYDSTMQLHPSLQSDFSWWIDHIMTSNNSIRDGNYALEIFSDASLTGWGASCNREKTGGFWNAQEADNHINFLELLAALNGLKCFAKDLKQREILLRIDNTTAISYINRYGGVQYIKLNNIAREIWLWCEERQLIVYASYIKSKDNIEADEESRRSNIDTEWCLSQSAFDRITTTFGLPEIDLFASQINAKCKNYISWKRDPEAFEIDAFTVDWSSYFFYAFPPFSLILKALRKIINEKATGIIVVPYWPSQPWYPIFMKLVIHEPIYFDPGPQLLLSPFRTCHPLWKRLTLVSALLSAKPI